MVYEEYTIRMRSILALLACAACSSDDVAGDYAVAVTNRENGCSIQNWTVGDQATGIAVTITQDGSRVTATVGGVTGALLDLALGARAYTGNVDGNDLDLEIIGTRPMQSGNCTFTYNSEILAAADGDVLTGTIHYRGAGNGNADCASITGCDSVQEFNGTRPPR